MAKRYGFILLLALSTAVNAADVSKKSGSYTGQFLKLGATARSAALAGAFCAQADDAGAIILNPGGLGFLINPEIQMMHSVWIADTFYNFAGYVQPTKLGTFGIAVQYFSGGRIDRIQNGVSAGKLNNYDAAYALSYSKALDEHFSAGLTLKNISSKLAGKSDSAQVLDLGFLFKSPSGIFTAGVAGENIGGGRLKYADSSDPIAHNAKAGFGLHVDLPEHHSSINFLTEAVFPSDNDPYYIAALEHWGGDVFALRFGYRFFTNDTNLSPVYNWRAGLGFDINGFLLDYAYSPMDILGNTHQISAGIRFRDVIPVKKELKIGLIIEPLIFSPNGDAVRDTVFITPEVTEAESIVSWKLNIISKNTNAVVRTFSGTSDLPQLLVWDGKDDKENIVDEGSYISDFTVKAARGRSGKYTALDIIVDLSPPEVSVGISSGVFSPDGDGVDDHLAIDVDAVDDSRIARWNVTILNMQDKIVRVIKSNEELPATVFWDGTDDYYNAVVPNGTYRIEVSVWDEAGNRGIGSYTEAAVNVPPKVIIKEITKEVEVKETELGLVINLASSVMYDTGKSALKPAAQKALDEVLKIIRAYPRNNVLIEGHTDSVGSEKSNTALSSARAWSVYSYLVKSGADPKMISVKGHGQTKPIASNATIEGRAKNRRVEITILKSTPEDQAEDESEETE